MTRQLFSTGSAYEPLKCAESMLGRPVLSASVATAYDILDRIGLAAVVPGVGTLLLGRVLTA